MHVYVLKVPGEYEDGEIIGVYGELELAQEAAEDGLRRLHGVTTEERRHIEEWEVNALYASRWWCYVRCDPGMVKFLTSRRQMTHSGVTFDDESVLLTSSGGE